MSVVDGWGFAGVLGSLRSNVSLCDCVSSLLGMCVKHSCPLLSRGERMGWPHGRASLCTLAGVDSIWCTKVSGYISYIGWQSLRINRTVYARALWRVVSVVRMHFGNVSMQGYVLECARSAPWPLLCRSF